MYFTKIIAKIKFKVVIIMNYKADAHAQIPSAKWNYIKDGKRGHAHMISNLRHTSKNRALKLVKI